MEAPATMPLIDNERPFESFEDLMSFRVQDILLVSSLYDSFILREDGRLNELLAGESVELHLQQIPGITHARSRVTTSSSPTSTSETWMPRNLRAK
jgi:hypothetical protein